MSLNTTIFKNQAGLLVLVCACSEAYHPDCETDCVAQPCQADYPVPMTPEAASWPQETADVLNSCEGEVFDAQGRAIEFRCEERGTRALVEYDDGGRITLAEFSTNGGSVASRSTYTYDESGRLASAAQAQGADYSRSADLAWDGPNPLAEEITTRQTAAPVNDPRCIDGDDCVVTVRRTWNSAGLPIRAESLAGVDLILAQRIEYEWTGGKLTRAVEETFGGETALPAGCQSTESGFICEIHFTYDGETLVGYEYRDTSVAISDECCADGCVA